MAADRRPAIVRCWLFLEVGALNCLAHAICFLDDPWLMVGTGLPDWLSMCDRRVRLRPRHVDFESTPEDPRVIAVTRGIRQHWHDDEWFHASPAFHEVSSGIGAMFRRKFDSGDNFRAGFLGHIALELLIDGILCERCDDALDRYYENVGAVNARELQELVNGLGARQTDAIIPFLSRYRTEQFLRDYVDDARLLYRLNRVLHRVRLPGLPDEAAAVVAHGRELVRDRLPELLNPEILAAG